MRKSGIFETAAFALATLLGGAGTAAAQETGSPGASPPGTIRVVGEATVTAKPDMAELDLGVVTEAPTAEAAGRRKRQEDGTHHGGAEEGSRRRRRGEDRRLHGHAAAGRAQEGRTQPAIVGYTVTNVVRTRIPDVKAAGKIIDLGLKNGANEVQRLVFTLKNPDPVQAEALKAAAAKARTRATALAAALGLRLGNVLSVSDGNFSARPVEMDMMRAKYALEGAESSNTPIDAGNLEVQATVTVFFATTPNR